MFVIEEELKKLPQKPGVYLMHDAQDNIIYVGKAIRLRSRVQSYFREKINRGPQIEKMVTQIARFEYIVTDSELEALVLENNLIKEHNPKYNTLLKDDKTYPYIKVTVGEAYPRVQFSRLMKKDKSKYFGPFTSAAAVKDTIDGDFQGCIREYGIAADVAQLTEYNSHVPQEVKDKLAECMDQMRSGELDIPMITEISDDIIH